MLTDDLLQLFLIEADLAGRFLQEGVVAHVRGDKLFLDYSREALVLAAGALQAVFRGEVAYARDAALIHTAQYFGETILRATSGEWAIRDECIDLRVRKRDGGWLWVDVYSPCFTIAHAARHDEHDAAHTRLVDTFDLVLTQIADD